MSRYLKAFFKVCLLQCYAGRISYKWVYLFLNLIFHAIEEFDTFTSIYSKFRNEINIKLFCNLCLISQICLHASEIEKLEIIL